MYNQESFDNLVNKLYSHDINRQEALKLIEYFDVVNDGNYDSRFAEIVKLFSDDKEIVLAVISVKPYLLKYASDRLKNDKEIVMHAVSIYGDALEYASDELKNDKEVLQIVEQKTNDATIKSNHNNKQEALDLVKNSDDRVQITEIVKLFNDDKEVVLTAISEKPYLLRYASDRLKNDKEVVMTAVSIYGDSLRYASNELRNDKEVVMAAIRNSDSAFEYASENLQKDEDILKAAGLEAKEENIEKSSSIHTLEDPKKDELDELYNQIKTENDRMEELINKINEENNRRAKLLEQLSILKEQNNEIQR